MSLSSSFLIGLLENVLVLGYVVLKTVLTNAIVEYLDIFALFGVAWLCNEWMFDQNVQKWLLLIGVVNFALILLFDRLHTEWYVKKWRERRRGEIQNKKIEMTKSHD